MNPLPLIMAGFLAASTSGATSTLDLHISTSSNGVQAQMTTNIRDGLHATMNWNGGEVTTHLQIIVGPATVTIDKVSGQPVKINMAGLSSVPTSGASANATGSRLLAATAPYAAPPAAGFLDSLGSFFSSVLNEVVLWLQTMVPFLILGILLILLLPRLGVEVRSTAMRRPWDRLGIGVVVLIAMPAAALALLVGGIFLGVWWLGLLILGLYGVVLAAGYTFSGMVIGRAVSDRLGWTTLPIFWALLGGLAVISLLTLVPYVGAVVAIVAVAYGIGALTLAPRTPETSALPAPIFRQRRRPEVASTTRQEIAPATAGVAHRPPEPSGTAEHETPASRQLQ